MGAVPCARNWLRECEAGAGNTVSVWVTLAAFCFFASDEGGLWVSEDTCARTLGLFLSQEELTVRGRACPFPVPLSLWKHSVSLSLSQAGHESSSMKPIFTKQPFPPGTPPSLCNLYVPCHLHQAGQPCPDCTTSLGPHRHISLQLHFPQPRRG